MVIILHIIIMIVIIMIMIIIIITFRMIISSSALMALEDFFRNCAEFGLFVGSAALSPCFTNTFVKIHGNICELSEKYLLKLKRIFKIPMNI